MATQTSAFDAVPVPLVTLLLLCISWTSTCADGAVIHPSLVVVAPGAHPRTQAYQSLAVNLAYPRLGHAQHQSNLLQVQLLFVVQRHHQLFAIGQSSDCL